MWSLFSFAWIGSRVHFMPVLDVVSLPISFSIIIGFTGWKLQFKHHEVNKVCLNFWTKYLKLFKLSKTRFGLITHAQQCCTMLCKMHIWKFMAAEAECAISRHTFPQINILFSYLNLRSVVKTTLEVNLYKRRALFHLCMLLAIERRGNCSRFWCGNVLSGWKSCYIVNFDNS
jgi:hypothetical protein